MATAVTRIQATTRSNGRLGSCVIPVNGLAPDGQAQCPRPTLAWRTIRGGRRAQDQVPAAFLICLNLACPGNRRAAPARLPPGQRPARHTPSPDHLLKIATLRQTAPNSCRHQPKDMLRRCLATACHERCTIAKEKVALPLSGDFGALSRGGSLFARWPCRQTGLAFVP